MKKNELDALLKKAMSLPLTPGVYIMKNRSGVIIYIGKAKKLRNRVSQYFARFESHTGKTRKMVESVDDFEYILTTSELEALTLECSLIKQHRPKYNILLKDDKGFCFIRLSSEEYPRLSVVYHKINDTAEYFGPYMSAGAARQTLGLACKLFLLPVCTKQLSYGKKNGRPCLNHYIKQCSAPCSGRLSAQTYAESVRAAVSFINGGMKSAVDDMTTRMREYSDRLEFEKAAQLRDKINAAQRIWQRQGVVTDECREHDMFALSSDGMSVCICVLNVRGGRMCLKEDFFFDSDSAEELPELLQSFICEYYSAERELPPVVASAYELAEYSLLKAWLSNKCGAKLALKCPGRGELPKTAKIAVENADEALVQHTIRQGGRESRALAELKSCLGLKNELRRIEAFDVSHTGGKTTVGGMIVFEDGAPKKSDYRRYKLAVSGGDDYGAMREMLSRRIARLGEKGFDSPDIILLDGGEAHVAVVQSVFSEKNIDIPLFGMVKDVKHKLRGLTTTDGEVEVGRTTRAFRLLYAISEEVHRYALSYHHRKRSAELRCSELLVIDNIGEVRAAALLREFGSIGAVAGATEEQLCSVKGMNAAAARSLRKYFGSITEADDA